MLLLLIGLVAVFGLGKLAMLGVLVVALLLGYEHSLVKADDLSKLNAAFFAMNGVISVVFFCFVAADLLLRRIFS
jgi:4-hydroxybenzoate polyprenyltransferase